MCHQLFCRTRSRDAVGVVLVIVGCELGVVSVGDRGGGGGGGGWRCRGWVVVGLLSSPLRSARRRTQETVALQGAESRSACSDDACQKKIQPRCCLRSLQLPPFMDLVVFLFYYLPTRPLDVPTRTCNKTRLPLLLLGNTELTLLDSQGTTYRGFF